MNSGKEQQLEHARVIRLETLALLARVQGWAERLEGMSDDQLIELAGLPSQPQAGADPAPGWLAGPARAISHHMNQIATYSMARYLALEAELAAEQE